MAADVFNADFVFNIEKRLRVINEMSYAAMLVDENTWWNKVVTVQPQLDGKAERLTWLLSTASIDQVTPVNGGEDGGAINFDQLAMVQTEYTVAEHRRGFKIGKMKYANLLSSGVDPVAKWVGDVSAYGAYYPQRLATIALLNGENVNGYDGVPFFSSAHPVHPLIPGLGTYANLFTGAASGSYPGALPIDDVSVTLDASLTNLSKALSYIMGAVSMPNGAGDPRFLIPEFLIHPPRMISRVSEMLDAEQIPIAATGGAGSADIRPFLKKFRLQQPILAKELDGSRTYTFPSTTGLGTSSVSGSDTTWYIAAREVTSQELGGLLLHVRQAFTLHTYSGENGAEGVDAVLGRSHDLEWHYDGWEAVNYGHPFKLFKFKAT